MPTSEEEGLEVTRWGTRFARRETEAEYRLWQRDYAVPFNRAGGIVAIILWVTGIPFVLLLHPEGSLFWAGTIGFGIIPTIGVAVFLSYRPALRPWMQPFMMVANGLAGVLVVCIMVFHLRVVEASAAFASVLSFFGFGILRIRPFQGVVGVTPYLVLDAWLISHFQGVTTGTISCWFALYITFFAGLLISVVLDVVMRQTFRRERIIEAQKATIVQERARTESLLRQELGHQVAQRSRELGEMLQRVDTSFVGGKLTPGERFDGRYLVKRVLGAGAMGTVYEVERTTDHQRLALKIVSGEVLGPQAARFAREAEIGARIRHPNVVSIVDVGISSGAPFLVMEMAEGGSLEEMRAQFGKPEWAQSILREIAAGIAALHDASVVHRDLKPANVLFSTGAEGERVAKISDFGISRLGSLEDAEAALGALAKTYRAGQVRSMDLTGTGTLLGTPLYMAPEAARGGRTAAAPADVFAFGIIACEVLTGQGPFKVPPLFLAMAGNKLPAPVVDGVPANLRDILTTCLAEDPASRPSIHSVRMALAK